MSPGLEGGSLRATVGAVKPRTDAAAAAAAAADNENNTHTPRAPDQQHTEPRPAPLLPSSTASLCPGVNANRQQLNCWQEASQAAWQLPHSITGRMTMMRWPGEDGGRSKRRMLSLGCMQYQQAAFRAGSWEQLLLFVLLRGSTQCWRHFAVCLSSCNKMASGMLFPLTTTTTMMMKRIIMMMIMMLLMLLTEC